MSLPNYDSVKQKIIDTLVGRPEGTEIDPANQQNYELSLLDYVKSVETSSQTPFKGIADENTVPLQPNNSFISYISVLNSGQSKTFKNFRNQSGQPISVTADTNKSHLIILVWNTQYWSVEKITIGVTTAVEVKAGAGLTAAEDGTISIANNANLPGSPTTTTQAGTDNSTKIATTEFVQKNFAKLNDDNFSLMSHGNEFNFANTTATSVYFNFRRKNNTDNPSGINIYIFTKGTNNTEDYAKLKAENFIFPDGSNAISSKDVGGNSNNIMKVVSFPNYVALGVSNNNDYFKALCKWVQANYKSNKRVTLFGSAEPNSQGVCMVNMYADNTVDADGNPKYMSGLYVTLEGGIYTFSYNNHVYSIKIATQGIPSSVNLPGSPTTTTQAQGDNSTKIATTAYVDGKIIAAGILSRETPTSKTSNWKIKTNIRGSWTLQNITDNGETAFKINYSGQNGNVIVLLSPTDGTGYMLMDRVGFFTGSGVGTNTLHSVKFVVMNIK